MLSSDDIMVTIDSKYMQHALLGSTNRGWDIDILLNAADINRELFFLPRCKLSRAQVVRLFKAIWKTTGDEFMGFTQNPCKNGVFALMLRSSQQYKTLDHFCKNAFHFYELFTDEARFELIKSGDYAHIRGNLTHPEFDPQHFLAEFWLLIWHRLFCWLIDCKIPLLKASFNYPEPEHVEYYHYLFACDLAFDQRAIELTFDSSFLHHKNIRTSRDVDFFLKDSPADLFTVPGENRTTATQVISLLLPENQTSDVLMFPSFEEVAEQLGATTQTLRRRLKREGASYQKIKDSLRHDLAIDLLTKESMSIQAVAQELGFSEPASFSKAFKLWTGVSPSLYLKESR